MSLRKAKQSWNSSVLVTSTLYTVKQKGSQREINTAYQSPWAEETEIVETESCLLKEGKATKNQLFLGQRSDPFIYGDHMPFFLALSISHFLISHAYISQMLHPITLVWIYWRSDPLWFLFPSPEQLLFLLTTKLYSFKHPWESSHGNFRGPHSLSGLPLALMPADNLETDSPPLKILTQNHTLRPSLYIKKLVLFNEGKKYEWINTQLTPKKKTAEDALQHGRGLCRVHTWERRTGSHSAV